MCLKRIPRRIVEQIEWWVCKRMKKTENNQEWITLDVSQNNLQTQVALNIVIEFAILNCHLKQFHLLIFQQHYPWANSNILLLVRVTWTAAEKSSNAQGNEQRALYSNSLLVWQKYLCIYNGLIDNQPLNQSCGICASPILMTLLSTKGCIKSHWWISPWIYIVSGHRRSLKKWLVSCCWIFRRYPFPCILTKDNFQIPLELLKIQWNGQRISISNVASNFSNGSQSITHQKHSRDSKLAYPRFSGHSKDWIELRETLDLFSCSPTRFRKHPSTWTAYRHHYLW